MLFFALYIIIWPGKGWVHVPGSLAALRATGPLFGLLIEKDGRLGVPLPPLLLFIGVSITISVAHPVFDIRTLLAYSITVVVLASAFLNILLPQKRLNAFFSNEPGHGHSAR